MLCRHDMIVFYPNRGGKFGGNDAESIMEVAANADAAGRPMRMAFAACRPAPERAHRLTNRCNRRACSTMRPLNSVREKEPGGGSIADGCVRLREHVAVTIPAA